MSAKQFILVLKNRVGALAKITGALAYEGVNILGISVRDLPDYTVVRMVTHDQIKTERLLKELGEDFETVPAIIVPMPHEPGALHRVTELISQNKLSIQYLYVVLLEMSKASILFRLDNHERGIELLLEKGYEFTVV